MASAAAKAVWGESKQSGEEPISGHTGDPSKGEPYDAGNIEDPKAQAAKLETANGATDSSAAHFSKETGTAAEAADTPANPSTDLKAKSGPKDSSKSQADTRDPSNPQTNPKAAPTDVDDAEDGPNEAQKLEGPGPKPLEEVARQHGGNAGVSDESVGKTAGGEGEEEEEDGPNAKSKGEGTGEQYVKSSGLKADGGDFDATKPGAGKEADRLMDEKGMHVANGNDADAAGHSEGHGDKKEKKSIGQKIKDKLHRH
ncbi:uncharacterized protein GGS22DRAFT_191649 [Annulohypoxylon maeteangense]|uniref:uncharacterized protein n=1 Tax=Annulohypoxylon maeteangense TaxID=1927788 RepID=UPI002007D3F7|nr:uncharacterized protein GGS22DRAFT_191649 [Annulohypoxylon maeteangense]KAI0881924.1 hypothetical protein GGS22DRAFT_191649 [Annulohypoxylon maeteangense]